MFFTFTRASFPGSPRTSKGALILTVLTIIFDNQIITGWLLASTGLLKTAYFTNFVTNF